MNETEKGFSPPLGSYKLPDWYYILFTLVTIGFGILIVIPMGSESGFIVIKSLCGLFFILFLSLSYSSFICRIELLPDRIRDVDVFGVKELKYSEIRGIRILKRYDRRRKEIIFIPNNPHVKKITITNDFHTVFLWAKATFKDLDEEAYQEELTEVLESYGNNESSYKKVYSWSLYGIIILTIFIATFPFWANNLFSSKSTIITMIFFPPLVILLALPFRNLIKLEIISRKSSSLTLMITLLIACVMLVLMTIKTNIQSYANFWAPFLLFASILFLLGVGISPSIQKHTPSLLSLMLCALMYGYGSIIVINTVLDSSQPITYQAKIIQKYIKSDTDSKYYRIRLSPWGPQKEETEFSVDAKEYQEREVNDIIEIHLYQGRFNIPYYYLDFGEIKQ